jgi:non-heme chloroperoxidase
VAVNRATQGMRYTFWLAGMLCGLKGAVDCIKAFSKTDLATFLASRLFTSLGHM